VTIVELLVAIVLLCVGVLGTIALIDGANAKAGLTSTREAATALTRHVLEASRIVPYHRLQQSSLPAALQELEDLSDQSSASGWNVRRRQVTFTLAVTVCTVDDPTDGGGAHSGSDFCGDRRPLTWLASMSAERTTAAASPEPAVWWCAMVEASRLGSSRCRASTLPTSA
jgi:type II secretory pathway pseudopilin PulG